MRINDLFENIEGVYSQDQFDTYISPTLNHLISHKNAKSTRIVGLVGGQGTGKSTLAKYLCKCLCQLGYRAITFSIDDFYSSHEERKILARKFLDNPLYQISRGMPGTHRVKELHDTLQSLSNGEPVKIPVFDKSLHNAQGDISDEVAHVTERQDFVFFEGWCIGMPELTYDNISRACAKRNYAIQASKEHINQVLGYLHSYQKVWAHIDTWIKLEATDLSLHHTWRNQQERELEKRTGRGKSEKEINEYVDHFIPFTCAVYELVKADITISLDKNRMRGINITS